MTASSSTISPRQAVIALQLGYAGWGVFWGAWGVLLPQFQTDLLLSDAAVGVTLMGIIVGAIPAMLFGSGLIERRPGASLRLLFVVFAMSVLTLGFASNAFVLLGLLVLLGIASGLLDVALNVNVAVAERRNGQRLFQKMHGAFPLGMIVAAPIVGMARDAGFGRVTILTCVAALLLLPLLAMGRNGGVKQDEAESVARPPAARSRLNQIRQLAHNGPLLVVSGLVTVLLFLEHAVEHWSALYVETTYASSASVSSLAPSFYMATLFLGRMIADRLEQRVSLGQFLRWGTVGTALCFFVFAYAGPLWLTLGAVLVMGLLMAPLVPGLYGWISLAVAEEQRGSVLGGVTAVSYLGYLASPAFVGALGSALSLNAAWAMLGIVAAIAVIASAKYRELH